MDAALQGYLEVHPSPKYVILNYDLGVLSSEKRLYNPIFYYYFLNNKAVYNAVADTDKFTWLYKHFPFMQYLRFNDDIRIEAIKGIMGKHYTFDSNYKGYSRMEETIGKFDTTYLHRDSLKYEVRNNDYLNNIINTCRQKDINLIFFVGPVYNHHFDKKYADYSSIIKSSNLFAKENNIPFIRFDSIPLNTSSDNFSDNIHLSEVGSKIFSLILVEKLKFYLKDY
ncbi:hypothetical protein DC498_11610 [Terrimonas sp.]|nr:hypothetical protein DC498_11610 [Terrimonas sp.]